MICFCVSDWWNQATLTYDLGFTNTTSALWVFLIHAPTKWVEFWALGLGQITRKKVSNCIRVPGSSAWYIHTSRHTSVHKHISYIAARVHYRPYHKKAPQKKLSLNITGVRVSFAKYIYLSTVMTIKMNKTKTKQRLHKYMVGPRHSTMFIIPNYFYYSTYVHMYHTWINCIFNDSDYDV